MKNVPSEFKEKKKKKKKKTLWKSNKLQKRRMINSPDIFRLPISISYNPMPSKKLNRVV